MVRFWGGGGGTVFLVHGSWVGREGGGLVRDGWKGGQGEAEGSDGMGFGGALYQNTLFHFVLFCSVLFCSVLFCSGLVCSVLVWSVLFCSVLFCSVVVWSGLFCSGFVHFFFGLVGLVNWIGGFMMVIVLEVREGEVDDW